MDFKKCTSLFADLCTLLFAEKCTFLFTKKCTLLFTDYKRLVKFSNRKMKLTGGMNYLFLFNKPLKQEIRKQTEERPLLMKKLRKKFA